MSYFVLFTKILIILAVFATALKIQTMYISNIKARYISVFASCLLCSLILRKLLLFKCYVTTRITAHTKLIEVSGRLAQLVQFALCFV